MEIVFLGIVVFLFVLAVFDLSVGVSNDAVNFLNSAIGAKAASFRVVITIAAIGVFMGAAMSNGMMDIARHGIFRPEHFSFYELMCIFMAVMVTDIILLDIFNSLGMPTSTTVSMVFELLGASFALALFKMAADTAGALSLTELLNTEKALSVIIGIFLSVAIAFFFGTLVQYLSRLIFTFNYKSRLKWKIGLFGGTAATAIVYFLLIKGIKDLSFMTPEAKQWIDDNTWAVISCCFVAFTIIMQLLHICRVNVFKVVVLMGTFSLAMAFAGNDLVNFIGVPLAGYSSYLDYTASGGGNPHTFMMSSLNAPAGTPVLFLVAAGTIMVWSLATSKKARNVVKTSVGLSRQAGGDEIFGSSRVARHLVRSFISFFSWVSAIVPAGLRRRVNARFNTEESIMADGAAFDLIRASVNLVLAGLLVALGTSLKLPLSTTYVTFMVAMGTSLADRAWGRESAVFRITGVLSVIGGWFITAGAAFIGAAVAASLMYRGGQAVIIIIAILALVVLIRSNIRYRKKAVEEGRDTLFYACLSCNDKQETWLLLQQYITEEQKRFMRYAADMYETVTGGFVDEDIRSLRKAERSLQEEKGVLKGTRRRETLCFRRINKALAVEKSTWFHLGNNSCEAMNYNLRRMNEVCREHVDNNFLPLPQKYVSELEEIRRQTAVLFERGIGIWENGRYEDTVGLRTDCEEMKGLLSKKRRNVFNHLQEDKEEQLTVAYVYLNILQETQEMISNLRHLLRAGRKLRRVTPGTEVAAGY